MDLIEHKVKQTPLPICRLVALGAVLLAGTCALSISLGLNPVFAQESNQSDHAPSGWFLAGSKPASYRTGVDRQMLRNALPSAYLVSNLQDTGGFGTLMQSINASQYAGKRVRLQTWVQAKDVAGWAGLWMRVDKGETVVGFDNMEQRAIRGTQPWTTYEVVLDVPADATGISFGALLNGRGEIWLNDVKVDVVGQDVPTTGTGSKGSLSATPVNLDFQK
jgi:hypothetical protein